MIVFCHVSFAKWLTNLAFLHLVYTSVVINLNPAHGNMLDSVRASLGMTLHLSYIPAYVHTHADRGLKWANFEVTTVLHPHGMEVKVRSSISISITQTAHHGYRKEIVM